MIRPAENTTARFSWRVEVAGNPMVSDRRGPFVRFLLEHVLPYWKVQAAIFLCLAAGVALSLVDPLVLRAIIDKGLAGSDRRLLLQLCALLVGVLALRAGIHLLSVWLYSYSGLRILFDLRRRVFDRLLAMPAERLHEQRRGDLLARLTSDVDILQRAAAHTVVNAAQDLLTIAGISGVLIWLDPWLTLVLALAYPPLVWLLARTNDRLEQEGRRARRSVSDLYSFFEERLRGLALIREFGRQTAEARRHVRLSRPWIRSNLSLSVVGAVQVSLADITTTLAFVLVFLIGGLRTASGSLSVGSLVAFYTLATRLYRPISGLIDINIDLQLARVSLQRIYALIDSEIPERPARGRRLPEGLRGEVCLENLSLRWEDGTIGLDRLSLEIPPGTYLALVGPSGSGKSTLARTLAGYLEPTSGAVRLDGRALDSYDWRWLRREIGLVSQQTLLFHASVESNLRLARPDASDEELLEALAVAGLDELLRTLPEGLDTLLGEDGLRLSGGERQRLALARMWLKRPSLLILDEATSALDARTERQILARLRERLEGRTLIVIAHRLPAVSDADRLLVLDGGRLAESGTHEELLERGDLYARLYASCDAEA